MVVVVDASALAKVFLNEEHAPALRSFLQDAIEEARDLVAPDLIAYELGNIVGAQFADETLDRQAQVLSDALALVRTVPLEEPDRVLRFVSDTGSFYDAAYLWAARRAQGSLLTYDERLGEAAVAHDVPVLRPGEGEPGIAGER